MAKPKYHPACLLFPPLSDEELKALAEDVRQNGLLHPIVTLDGQILDGRNRLAACKIAGVKPRFVEWAGEGDGSPLDWVVATNLVRRHLTPSQRAVVAFELLPMLETEAKARQRQSRGRGKRGGNEQAAVSGKASQIAARITKSNSAYVEQVKAISRTAAELIPQIKIGRVTVTDALRLSKLDGPRRIRILKEGERRPTVPLKKIMRSVLIADKRSPNSSAPKRSDIEIWCGDCLELMRTRIANESVSVITTSPPFNQNVKYASYNDNRDEDEYLAWLDSVLSELHRVLKPDGSLFLDIAHSPKKPWTAMRVAQAAAKQFFLQNQIIWVKCITVDGQSHGHFSPIQGTRFLNRNWHFLFHFTKTGSVSLARLAAGVPYESKINSARTGSSVRCAGDVWFLPHETIRGSEERAEHPATFPPALSKRCLKLAGVKAGMLVLDPFCGINGMLGARNLGVCGIGIDIDPGYCQAARLKLENNSLTASNTL